MQWGRVRISRVHRVGLILEAGMASLVTAQGMAAPAQALAAPVLSDTTGWLRHLSPGSPAMTNNTVHVLTGMCLCRKCAHLHHLKWTACLFPGHQHVPLGASVAGAYDSASMPAMSAMHLHLSAVWPWQRGLGSPPCPQAPGNCLHASRGSCALAGLGGMQ